MSGAKEHVCLCTCHAPHHDVWAGWCDDCDSTHAADLVQVARHELYCLWGDMAEASRHAINTSWSINMSGIAGRIAKLSRHAGVMPWQHASVSLLRNGTYQRVHDQAGLEYPPIDWERVAEVEDRISGQVDD